jgi:hypothetical protein
MNLFVALITLLSGNLPVCGNLFLAVAEKPSVAEKLAVLVNA